MPKCLDRDKIIHIARNIAKHHPKENLKPLLNAAFTDTKNSSTFIGQTYQKNQTLPSC